ncbi:HNH endonuclease [Dyella sp. S184]|uniref:HNH endonuclease n=1 Tax=Dyella sp. S184 TaxID=1641862 RepID=UPI001C209424|nr:HNH endonuclease [Dyella sp. S184]
MDEKIARTIRNLNDWKALRTFEKNVRSRGAFNDEIQTAIRDRATELGMALITEKTGLVLSELSPAESKIVKAVAEYVGLMQKQEKYPGRTFTQLRNRGLIDAAETSVSQRKPTQGFKTLIDADLEELSYERIVLDHPEEFSARALWFSRRTLGEPNPTTEPPAATHSNTQERTRALLDWFRTRAETSGGVLSNFTNADAAEAIGFGDLQRFGQVYGNLQSRIDYACFRVGLPPLGCASDAPFSRAWSKQDRTWAFPIPNMQAAARSHGWTEDDFALIEKETERVPSMAHIVWKAALTEEEDAVRIWAMGLQKSPDVPDVEELVDDASRRNPTWVRDELILALDLYVQHGGNPPGKQSDEIVDLSVLLGDLGRLLGLSNDGAYRNANGVYMKLMNFRRFDPQFIDAGKVGLQRGGKLELEVWDEFANDRERLSSVASAIKASIRSDTPPDLDFADEMDVQEAPEGRILTRLHRRRERSKKLTEAAKRQALKTHKRLFCEACGFDFERAYGIAGTGIIDVHHTKPVHTLVEGETTKVEDLALLCSNCHRIVHSKKRWLSLDEVRGAIRGQGEKTT